MKIRSRAHDRTTLDGIVQAIVAEWSPEDLEFVRARRYDFGMIERRIRNEFGLWDPTHPLTAQWHAKPEERDVRDGIDHSVDHPDAISSAIHADLLRALA